MTYVTEQTSDELRAHMRRITAMPGWNEPLSARLWEEVQKQDSEIEKLREAAHRMMIGGNHIALYKTERWPEPGTDPEIALRILCATPEYDMWCCWNAIMCARNDAGLI